MSQHQAGSAGPAVKRLKQTALTWKAKNKATSQLARSDARLAGLGVNQREQGETVYMHTYIHTHILTYYIVTCVCMDTYVCHHWALPLECPSFLSSLN